MGEDEHVRLLIEKLGLEVTVRPLAGGSPTPPEEQRPVAPDEAAERMDLVARFAGGVAHDLNNLLTTIAGYTELIVSRMSESNPLRRDAVEVERAVDRASQLTRRLLAVARRQLPRPVVLDLNALLTSLEPRLRELAGPGVELSLALAPGAPTVKASPEQLGEIVLLLVESAVAAAGGRGRVHIESSPGDPAGKSVRLTVTDSGPALSEADRTRIFEPFRVEEGGGRGSGLLLAAVHGMVVQNGGAIAVATGTGGETTFTIVLPGAAEVAAAAAEPPASLETVLVAEDEDTVRAMVCETLERRGYRVLVARNGADALTVAQQYDGPIHLLLSDVSMPGVSGVELATLLRQSRPGMRVLYMSGAPADDVARDLEVQAGTGFVAKPITPSALAARVRDALDARVGGLSVVTSETPPRDAA